MTQRSALAQRLAEFKGKAMVSVANRTFSKRDTALDKAAKALAARMAPELDDDELLEHEPLVDPELRELG